ncbi:hypothetical protein PHK61_09640 [Actinomycetospora lutea]|uniref:hypothetical protein n=1 Tax=Actinomycetospora lutea TaxID=663604 RepID=UPI0023651283|nr:hypothetical protein [Actinomycetospora lutea]MDD7938677.1 hypothetical protein [Actinomycetospora lutea]
MSIDGYLTTPALEDAGARTADLFDWQAAAAAVDALAQLAGQQTDPAPTLMMSARSIICEHHEDYACVADDNVELVSVKHRENSQGAWTWTALIVDGGLAHLFARWRAFGEKFSCRIVTNAGLKSGDAASLHKACECLRHGMDDDESEAETGLCVQRVCILFLRNAELANLPDEWRIIPTSKIRNDTTPHPQLHASVEAFLALLVVDCSRPHRDDIAHVAPSKYVEPVLALLSLDNLSPRAGWTVVLDLFRARMKSRGPTRLGDLDRVLSIAMHESPGRAQARELRRRRVSIADVEEALRHAASNPGAYEAPNERTALTTLAIKLIKGGCSVTTVRVAEDLAGNWRALRRVRTADVPGASAKFSIAEHRLRTIASVAADDAMGEAQDGNGYGRAMWRLLTQRIRATDFALLEIDPEDDGAVLGGVCDLASRCVVWFGPEFNIPQARAELAEMNRAGSEPA